MSQVEKHDRGKRCETNLAPNVGLKKKSSKMTTDIDTYVKNCEKTETKDPTQ